MNNPEVPAQVTAQQPAQQPISTAQQPVQQPSITAPVVVKQEDPCRVAQGKKLAAISKAAKAAKKQRLEESKRNDNTSSNNLNSDEGEGYITSYFVFGLIGTIVSVGGLYLTWSRGNLTQEQRVVEDNTEEEPKVKRKVARREVLVMDGLEGFD